MFASGILRTVIVASVLATANPYEKIHGNMYQYQDEGLMPSEDNIHSHPETHKRKTTSEKKMRIGQEGTHKKRKAKSKKGKGKHHPHPHPPHPYPPPPPPPVFCEGDNQLKAFISGIFGSNYLPPPNGYVCTTFFSGDSNDMDIFVDMAGLEPACSLENTRPSGCAVQIKNSSECTANTASAENFFNTTDDPFLFARYSTFKTDVAKDRVFVPGGNGFTLAQNEGKAVVIYGKAGAGIACGLLTNF
mmetsp:Transcript_41644/g.61116  ORF Transcript_41644/g.61116 Transcript_41644/m.61116 type:complete len:246 (-) Transcript_41644:163-900(-)